MVALMLAILIVFAQDDSQELALNVRVGMFQEIYALTLAELSLQGLESAMADQRVVDLLPVRAAFLSLHQNSDLLHSLHNSFDLQIMAALQFR